MIWLTLALLASVAQAFIPLIQEKWKVETVPLVFWMRVILALFLLPVVLFVTGVPSSPRFYMMMAASALLFAVSDIVYFNQVKIHGAGIISRILPVSAVLSFLVWFIVDPALLDKYIRKPYPFFAILACISLSAFCAVMLKKNPVSWAALKSVWIVIVAAVLAPILAKLIVGQAQFHEGPYAYAFFECFFVAVFYAIYGRINTKLIHTNLTDPMIIKVAFYIALAWIAQHVLKSYAYQLVDNPGFVVVILFLDAVWITLLYITLKKREGKDVFWGLGLVASAFGLIAVKSIYFQ